MANAFRILGGNVVPSYETAASLPEVARSGELGYVSDEDALYAYGSDGWAKVGGSDGGGSAIIPKYSEVTNPTVGQLAYVPGREEQGEEEEAAIILPQLLIYCEDAEGRGWYSVGLDQYQEE